MNVTSSSGKSPWARVTKRVGFEKTEWASVMETILNSLLHLQKSVESWRVVVRDTKEETTQGAIKGVDIHGTGVVNLHSELKGGVSAFQFTIIGVVIKHL